MTDTAPKIKTKAAEKAAAAPAVNDDQDATVGTAPAKQPAAKVESKSAEPKAT